MKKYFLFVLALLLSIGVANAAGIPAVVDPLNAPEVWTQEVYNNAGSNLTSGTVVVWNMASDTTDASYAYRTSWVSTTTTADDILVAGIVVDDVIPTATVGTIAIYGPVYARVADSSDAVTAADLVGTYTTAGLVGDFGGAAADVASLGFCIYAAPVSASYGGYVGVDGKDDVMIPIFVDIARFSDD